jgi:transcriptional regulator with XRE-family HTH domain
MSKVLQDNIKRHLQVHNMSAAELERRTGIPHAVVNILHGRSKNPSLKTAQAIAKELGCTVEELLAEDVAAVVNPAKQAWNPGLYNEVFQMVFNCIQKLKLQPEPEQIGAWLTEVYNYSLGNPELKVDQRFVVWLLSR